MKFLKSRTVLTAIILFLFNGFQALEQSIPNDTFVAINGLFAVLIAYFRVNAKVQ